MLLAIIFGAIGLACNFASSATVPYQKVYYDLDDAQNIYINYLKEHNKHRPTEEFAKRLQIFKDNLRECNELNARHPLTVYGPTMFSDLTEEEKKNARGCALPYKYNGTRVALKLEPMNYKANFDWREKNIVTPVKHQGECGSCYIFSAIANIEGQYALKYQQSLSFSEQQALDCTPNDGCDGGYPHEVMNGLAKNEAGVMLETDYPYTERKGTCRQDASKKRATVTGGQVLSVNDEEQMKEYLVQYGPLAIGMYSSALDNYRGGIIIPETCGGFGHAVLIVGYGEENGTPFWSAKNSYGRNWGESGYFRIHRGSRACDIGSYVANSQIG